MPDNLRWIPNEWRRKWASTIDPSEVECLKFGGPQMGGFIGYDPIIVYDRRLIRLFIDALKQASLPAPPEGAKALEATMGSNEMMICLKQYGKADRRVERVMFFPHRPENCFGPAFYQALGELSRHQAERVRQRARQLLSQVVVVRVNDKAFRDQSTVRRLLAELQQLDEKAFTYTESSYHLSVTLVTKNGKEWRTTLVVSGSAVEAARERRAPPPLPPTLWRLFERGEPPSTKT